MISKEDLMQVLIMGRNECYIKKSLSYNPYSGVEYVYTVDNKECESNVEMH